LAFRFGHINYVFCTFYGQFHFQIQNIFIFSRTKCLISKGEEEGKDKDKDSIEDPFGIWGSSAPFIHYFFLLLPVLLNRFDSLLSNVPQLGLDPRHLPSLAPPPQLFGMFNFKLSQISALH
jgi:hypothetical protein